MRVFSSPNGLCIANGASILVDPKGSPSESFVVSHAHFDHLAFSKNSESKVLSTPETLALADSRKKGTKNVQALAFGKKAQVGDLGVSLYSSCHILGSAQTLVEGEKRVAVTSDLQLLPSLLLPEAPVLACDWLVIESTFGLPSFKFPPREKVYEEMAHWIKREVQEGNFVVLAGYVLGKAQELTKIVNEFTPFAPLVHESVFNFNELYGKMGAKLGEFEKLDHNAKDFNVLILPPSLCNHSVLDALQYSIGRKVSAAMATGWNFHSPHFDRMFALSDHADFEQLLRYVKDSGAKKVYTHHGYCKEFARHVQRQTRVPAQALEDSGQKRLDEW
ncbi:MAG: MBL fold metallo-hydrolase [Candidatus Diapherotrites archaeon]